MTNPQPGDVLEFENEHGFKLIVLILKRYPLLTCGEEVQVLWLLGHNEGTPNVTEHRAHVDSWFNWRKLCGSV